MKEKIIPVSGLVSFMSKVDRIGYKDLNQVIHTHKDRVRHWNYVGKAPSTVLVELRNRHERDKVYFELRFTPAFKQIMSVHYHQKLDNCLLVSSDARIIDVLLKDPCSLKNVSKRLNVLMRVTYRQKYTNTFLAVELDHGRVYGTSFEMEVNPLLPSFSLASLDEIIHDGDDITLLGGRIHYIYSEQII